MPDFVCAICQNIEKTSVGNFYIQYSVEKKRPVCYKCKNGKPHNKYKPKKATVEEILKGDVIYFDNFKDAKIVKDRMIDFITNNGKSCIPRNKFERMSVGEVLTIYRHLKGK